MLRRQARLRREYLYRKSVEDKHKSIQAKKDQLKRSLEENIPIHGDLRKEALSLQKRIEFEDKGKFMFGYFVNLTTNLKKINSLVKFRK